MKVASCAAPLAHLLQAALQRVSASVKAFIPTAAGPVATEILQEEISEPVLTNVMRQLTSLEAFKPLFGSHVPKQLTELEKMRLLIRVRGGWRTVC